MSLLLTTTSVTSFLDDLAAAAATSLGPPLSCGITVRRDEHPWTVASSDALALAVDEVQYGRDVGPCLESLDTGKVIWSDDLADEPRWGDFTGHAVAHGVRSSLSLPLRSGDDVIGALNLYATEPHTFVPTERREQGLALAAQASAVLTVSRQQARQAELTEQLRAALSSRSVIDQAVGILMAQQRCSSSQAFSLLRRASQNRNRKLRDVAIDVVAATGGEPPVDAPFFEPL